ncbi:MAG: HlyU family transcriptional regulator [Motiliproteus sp.]
MGFFSSIKSLFGADEAPVINADPVEYNGYNILPTPQKADGQFRIAALITKGDKEHQFVRCDLVMELDECIEITLYKAKMTIDQQGDSIFPH